MIIGDIAYMYGKMGNIECAENLYQKLYMVVSALMNFKIPIIGIVGLIIACIGYVYFLIFWRCPFCHELLPFYGRSGIVSCPYCGNKLDS